MKPLRRPNKDKEPLVQWRIGENLAATQMVIMASQPTPFLMRPYQTFVSEGVCLGVGWPVNFCQVIFFLVLFLSFRMWQKQQDTREIPEPKSFPLPFEEAQWINRGEGMNMNRNMDREFMHITWPLHDILHDISTWLTRIFKLPMQAFDVRELHRSPPFFSDQGGTFEVVEDASSAGLRPIHVEESRRIWWW